MRRVISASALYFAVVFAAGFAIGTLRVIFVEPYTGALAATIAEAPAMLLISWIAAAWSIRRLDVPAAIPARLSMGVLAFSLLFAAEIALGAALFSRDFGAQFLAMKAGPGLVGLVAQVLFAAIPAVQLLARRL